MESSRGGGGRSEKPILSPRTKRRIGLGVALLPVVLGAAVWVRNLIAVPKSEWFNPGLDLVGGVSVVYEADWSTAAGGAVGTTQREQLLRACKDVLLTRLEAKGIEGSEIRVASSQSCILVDIPNVSNPDQILDLVGRTGKLEFRPVLDESSDEVEEAGGQLGFTRRGAPTDVRLGPPVFTGDQLDTRKLRVLKPELGATDERASFRLAFEFRPDVADEFQEYAVQHRGQRLAITLDRDIRVVAQLNPETHGGGGGWVLTGQYTLDEAQDHFLLLKHGELPVELRQSTVTLVGASLGASFRSDAFRGLAWASAGLLITLFVFYGRRPWLLLSAVVALCALVLAFTAGLSFWQMRMTIVAIAGCVMTFGMGVDTTVIILESIRESLHRIGSRGLDAASQMLLVKTSYKERFEQPILVHATVTNLVGAGILLSSSVLRSYAQVMVLGVFIAAANILLTREVLLGTRQAYRKTLQLVPDWHLTSFPFARWRKPGALFCGLSATVGAFVLLTAGMPWGILKLGSEFRAGTEITVRVPPEVSAEDVVEAVRNRIPGEWKIQRIGSLSDGTPGGMSTYRLGTTATALAVVEGGRSATDPSTQGSSGIQASRDPVSLLGDDLRSLTAQSEQVGEIVSVEEVGPTIAAARLRSIAGVMAVVVLAVVLYTSLSLRIGGYCVFGLFLASAHDVLAMLAVLAIAKMPMTYPVVGAMVMVIGYSINDSIILLVRIKQVRDASGPSVGVPPAEVVSSAIRECWGRTVMTSLTTCVPMAILMVAGGEALRGFALTVTAGVVAGTLSSLFVVGTSALPRYATRREPHGDQPLSSQELEALVARRGPVV